MYAAWPEDQPFRETGLPFRGTNRSFLGSAACSEVRRACITARISHSSVHPPRPAERTLRSWDRPRVPRNGGPVSRSGPAVAWRPKTGRTPQRLRRDGPVRSHDPAGSTAVGPSHGPRYHQRRQNAGFEAGISAITESAVAVRPAVEETPGRHYTPAGSWERAPGTGCHQNYRGLPFGSMYGDVSDPAEPAFAYSSRFCSPRRSTPLMSKRRPLSLWNSSRKVRTASAM